MYGKYKPSHIKGYKDVSILYIIIYIHQVKINLSKSKQQQATVHLNIIIYDIYYTNVNIIWGEPEQVIIHDVMHVIVLYATYSQALQLRICMECFSIMFA